MLAFQLSRATPTIVNLSGEDYTSAAGITTWVRCVGKAGRSSRRLDPNRMEAAAAEWRKAPMRAKVEHTLLYVKRHFGNAKVRYRELAKNTHRVAMMLGFANQLIAEQQSSSTKDQGPDTADRCGGHASEPENPRG